MRFTAVLRANSRAKVRRTDPPLILQNFPSPVGSLTIVIRTRHDEKEFGIAVPRELWVEARGDGPSLEDGLNAAWGAAASVLPVIALVTNAAISDLQPHLAFETTETAEDRAFFQSTVDSERGIPLPGRRIPVEATVAMFEAIARTGRANVRDASRWNRRIWGSWSGEWSVYCVRKPAGCRDPDSKALLNPQTDHVHISFDRGGARMRTTFWNPETSRAT